MKTLFIRFMTKGLVIAGLLLCFSATKGSAQSKIYGVSHNHLVSFDYITGDYDTIDTPGLMFPSTNVSFGVTIDPYNGRYFYNDPLPLGMPRPVNYIDLNTLSTGNTCIFPERDYIEYNCLLNSLVFTDMDGHFYSYGMESGVLELLSDIPDPAGSIHGQSRTFNAFNNTYLLNRPFYYFDVIDGANGRLIHSQLLNGYYGASFLVSDYQTGIHYGVYHDTVVTVDPMTGIKTPLIALPIPLIHLNAQMAVYHQDSGKYIIPCIKSDISEGYYIVVDVRKPVIDTVLIQPDLDMEWQQIYCQPQTRVTQCGDSLLCSRGNNHQWFLNGIAIPNANGNLYIPTQSGQYKATVEYPQYVSTSNEVDVVMTNSKGPEPSEGVRCYPNPATTYTILELASFSNPGWLTVNDSRGCLTISQPVTANRHRVDLSGLSCGAYTIRYHDNNRIFTCLVVKL